jgi:hypothetical protein
MDFGWRRLFVIMSSRLAACIAHRTDVADLAYSVPFFFCIIIIRHVESTGCS